MASDSNPTEPKERRSVWFGIGILLIIIVAAMFFFLAANKTILRRYHHGYFNRAMASPTLTVRPRMKWIAWRGADSGIGNSVSA